MRRSKENLLKECQLSLRKQKYAKFNYCMPRSLNFVYRYIELSASSPVEAVTYLQKSVAALVDHDDQNDSKQVYSFATL